MMGTLPTRGWIVAALLAAAPGCGDPCRTSAACADEGRCVSHGNACIAHDDGDCRASALCKKEGRCRAMGQCVADATADCAASASASPCSAYRLFETFWNAAITVAL